MRFPLTLVLLLLSVCPVFAEQNYFFSPDSSSIVTNRIKVNLHRRNTEDFNILFSLRPSFKQEGDKFLLYGKSDLARNDGLLGKPRLLYTVHVFGSEHNRTFVQVVPAPGKDDLLVSNIEYFMQGVVEKRESRVFKPAWDKDRELTKVLLSGAFWEISTTARLTEELEAKAGTVFAAGNVNDAFHEAQVFQVIADAEHIVDYNRECLARYDAKGENPVIDGVNLKDAFRRSISGLNKQIKVYRQYKSDYFDDSYGESKSRYEKLKLKLKEAYGYGYSSGRMSSGAYCLTSDGGSVLAGLTVVDKQRKPLLLKFDKKGRLLSHKIFSADSEQFSLFRGITEAEDSNLLGVVEKIEGSSNLYFVVKMNSKGDLLWQKDFDNIVLNGIIYDPQGFYYVVGRTRGDNCSGFLAKLDLQGNILTRSLFGSGSGRNSLVSGVVLADDSLVVVGYGTKSGDTERRAMMLHLSDSDRLLSESYHGSGGGMFFSVSPSPDNTLLTAGTGKAKDVKKAVVYKLDLDGHEIWQTTIFAGLKDQNSAVYAIKAKGEEAILVGSAMEYGFVAKLNKDGELLWRDVYGESEKVDQLRGLCLSPSGKIWVAGETKSYASMGKQNLWHFELDDKPGKVFKAPPKDPDAAFLIENKNKAGVITLASGAQYKVLREGTGSTPTFKDIVNIHYHGTFIDGKVFDSTYDRRESLEMEVEYFVKGLQELLQKMKVGCKWQLFIPAGLAYGEKGRGAQIPPDKTLIYEIELLEIKK